jgi:hypothetical protein
LDSIAIRWLWLFKGNANEFSIAAHGDGNGIWDERLGYKRRVPLDANALAEIIVNHPQYAQTKVIRLLSCRSADGGMKSFAAMLQAALKINVVIGTEGRVYGDRNGNFTPFFDRNSNRRWDANEPKAPWTIFQSKGSP